MIAGFPEMTLNMRLLLLASFMFISTNVMAGDLRVVAYAVDSSANTQSVFRVGEPKVDFWLEPLYPTIKNQTKATLELYYVCVDVETGMINPSCWIQLEKPVARENAGGHHAGHVADRPTGRHSPEMGWADERTGRFKSTFYASEVSGVVDVKINCSTGGFGTCSPGNVSFGVATQGFVELLPGPGYILVGSKAPHPSNHWGDPSFVRNVALVAAKYIERYPGDTLQYNDISLEFGGIFDVRTRTDPGYDWTPPHVSHRLGRNMDIGIPSTVDRRHTLEALYRAKGITVKREDSFHWHLIM